MLGTDHATIEELSALLDGELTLDEQAKVEEHLDGCLACRRELEDLRQTVMRVSQLPTLATPRSFVLPSESRSVAVPFHARIRPELLRAFAGVAAVVMVLLFAADAARVPTTVATLESRDTAPALAPQPNIGSVPAESVAPGAASGSAASRFSVPPNDAPNASSASNGA